MPGAAPILEPKLSMKKELSTHQNSKSLRDDTKVKQEVKKEEVYESCQQEIDDEDEEGDIIEDDAADDSDDFNIEAKSIYSEQDRVIVTDDAEIP